MTVCLSVCVAYSPLYINGTGKWALRCVSLHIQRPLVELPPEPAVALEWIGLDSVTKFYFCTKHFRKMNLWQCHHVPSFQSLKHGFSEHWVSSHLFEGIPSVTSITSADSTVPPWGAPAAMSCHICGKGRHRRDSCNGCPRGLRRWSTCLPGIQDPAVTCCDVALYGETPRSEWLMVVRVPVMGKEYEWLRYQQTHRHIYTHIWWWCESLKTFFGGEKPPWFIRDELKIGRPTEIEICGGVDG